MNQPTMRRRGVRPEGRYNRPAVAKIEVPLDQSGNPIIESWQVYRVLANQTESQPAKWSKESTSNLRLVHHLLGIATEVNELLPPEDGLGVVAPNAVEELGDMLWYLANIHTLLIAEGVTDVISRIDIMDLLSAASKAEGIKIGTAVAALRTNQVILMDEAKRILAYGDGSFPAGATNSVLRVHDMIKQAFSLAALQGFELDPLTTMNINIAKLRKRYKEGFDAEEAVNRQLQEEARVMARTQAGAAQRQSEVAASNPPQAAPASAFLDVEGAMERQAKPLPRGQAGRGCRNC